MGLLAEENLGVVIVDDDPVFRDLICATVAKKSKFVMFEAESGASLFDILDSHRIDCIVLDYDLGGETGLAIKQRIDESYPDHPPMIMMTGDGRESTAIRAFRMGVDDYIPKGGLRPESLVTSVLKVVEGHRHASLAKAEHRRLVAAFAVDIVTGLEGRPRLDERLAHLASLPPLARASYALILIELIEYSSISAQFGFKAADQALRHFAKSLQQLVRSNDICGRYQDGTFLMIADVRADPALFEQISRRLTENLSLRFIFSAADLTLSARVAGSVCAVLDHSHEGVASDLIAWVSAKLVRAMPAESPCPSIGFVASQRSSPEDSPTTPVVTSRHDQEARAAADELRSADRRRAARQRVFKRGLIHIVGTQATINCNVRNQSPNGAGLRLEAPCAVPGTFNLEVVGSGQLQRVRVCWQIAKDLGVEFLGKVESRLP